jgi:hypothetical protein
MEEKRMAEGKCEHEDDSIEDMRKRHLRIGIRFQAVAVYALEELEAKMASGQPLNLSAEDAKILLDAGAKIERAALGEKEREPHKAEKKLN